jgi:MFS family permease
VNLLKRTFNDSAVPRELRWNFIHLYLDIGWFGLLAGSAANFVSVYATRLGATTTQIGLFTATGAFMSLIVALPAGRWLETRHIGKATFWSSVLFRIGYLLWVFLPWMFGNKEQIWALIFINLLMGIPLTALGLSFTAFFAEAVPIEWRAHVTGVRNAVQAIVFMSSSLASGYLLDHLPFPGGYQLVFLIGFIGAAMSSFHLYFIKPASELLASADSTALPPVSRTPRPAARVGWRAAIRLDVWKGNFRRIMFLFLFFHLAQQLAIPLFTPYMVNTLHLNDSQIGIGTALFYLTVLIGSTQLSRIVRVYSHQKVTGIGVALLSVYPILMAFSTSAFHFYLVSTIGGLVWSLVGGAYLNYILENIPSDDRPAYLAWYNIVANLCILSGSLIGPLIAGWTGLAVALIIFGVLRGLAGLAILKYG